MPDLELTPVSGFAGLMHTRGASPFGVQVTDLDGSGFVSLMSYRGTRAALAQQVSETYAIELPDGPFCVSHAGISIMGTGSDRWMVHQPGAGNRLAAALDGQLAGLAAVVDQSDGYVLLRLQGKGVRRVLAKGVSLDFHPDAFKVNQCAATSIAHIGITIWRCADAPDGSPVFELALFRSMAGSFWHWLSTSGAEYGITVSG